MGKSNKSKNIEIKRNKKQISKLSKNNSKPQNGKKITKSQKADKKIEMSLQKKTGGKAIFQIVPDNDDDEKDAFAALGYSDSERENEEFENEEHDEEEIDEEFDENEEQEAGQGQQEDGEAKQEQNQNEGDDVDCDAQQQKLEEQAEGDDKEPVDISVINLQIQETIAILMNVVKLGEGKPRKYYLNQLKQLVHRYYGYNFELIDHFLNFFNPTELIQFFEANQTQRPLTIRTNTLKTRRKQLAQCLIQRGVNLDPLAEWSKVGIKIYESKVPIGATPQYLAGYYMLQSASSFLPVIALDPQVGERILDLASAPGGKTTYIAQLMKNTGCIFANDLKKERLKALQFNLYRLGITNTSITCRDGRKYGQIFPGSFDRVLLDAPCTGLGIISKDSSIKANRLLIDIYKNSHLQKQLILAAIDCTKVGGTIVYSTCSVSPLQNEEVVNYALKRRFIKIVESGIEVGEEGLTKFTDKRFHVDLKKTRRIYPHVHNMDGFYVAKLVKIAKGKREYEEEEDKQEK